MSRAYDPSGRSKRTIDDRDAPGGEWSHGA